jgi:hypothetical protein
MTDVSKIKCETIETKIELTSNSSPHWYSTEHLMSAVLEQLRESNLNYKTSTFLIWYPRIDGIQSALTHTQSEKLIYLAALRSRQVWDGHLLPEKLRQEQELPSATKNSSTACGSIKEQGSETTHSGEDAGIGNGQLAAASPALEFSPHGTSDGRAGAGNKLYYRGWLRTEGNWAQQPLSTRAKEANRVRGHARAQTKTGKAIRLLTGRNDGRTRVLAGRESRRRALACGTGPRNRTGNRDSSRKNETSRH